MSVLRAALLSTVVMQGVCVAFGGCAFPLTVAAVVEETDGGSVSIAPATRDSDAAPRFADDAAPQPADADGGPADAPSLHDPSDPVVDAADDAADASG